MPRTAAHVAACRDEECNRAEHLVGAASDAAVRGFLKRVNRAIRAALADPAVHALRASAMPVEGAGLPSVPTGSFELFTLGEAQSWWDEALGEELVPALTTVWKTGYQAETTLATGLDAVPEYLARVRDRLSPTIGPSLPADAFNMARTALTEGLALGMPPKKLAASLAATFGWDAESSKWDEIVKWTDEKIDAKLDAIGPPGDPAREAFKATDPQIAQLIKNRNKAVAGRDKEESVWRTRATRIARTETTGALNAGALAAFHVEGVKSKEWVTTSDGRTRKTHMAAGGQIVPLGEPFKVGGASLQMPGDPSGPAREVVNCRCAMVAAEYADLPPELEVIDGDGEIEVGPLDVLAQAAAEAGEAFVGMQLQVAKLGPGDVIPGVTPSPVKDIFEMDEVGEQYKIEFEDGSSLVAFYDDTFEVQRKVGDLPPGVADALADAPPPLLSTAVEEAAEALDGPAVPDGFEAVDDAPIASLGVGDFIPKKHNGEIVQAEIVDFDATVPGGYVDVTLKFPDGTTGDWSYKTDHVFPAGVLKKTPAAVAQAVEEAAEAVGELAEEAADQVKVFESGSLSYGQLEPGDEWFLPSGKKAKVVSISEVPGQPGYFDMTFDFDGVQDSLQSVPGTATLFSKVVRPGKALDAPEGPSAIEEAAALAEQRAAANAAAAKAVAAAPLPEATPAEIKKWKGKPKPTKPIPPVAPEAETYAQRRWGPWLEEVKADYAAFLDANPQFPKKSLEQSNNWFNFSKLINGEPGADSALDFLASNNYLSPKLVEQARDNLAFAKTAQGAAPYLDEAADAAYKKAVTAFKRASTTHKKQLAAWQRANGIDPTKVPLQGMNGVDGPPLNWHDDSPAITWGRENYKIDEGPRKTALKTYTGSSYREINSYLRTNEGQLVGGRWDQTIKDMDAGMIPAPEGFIWHRGASWFDFGNDLGQKLESGQFNPRSLIGTVQQQNGYSSGSTGTRAAFPPSPVRWVVHVPKGTPSFYVQPFSNVVNEREMVLARGSRYLIHDVYYDGKDWVVEAEVLPPDIDESVLAELASQVDPLPSGTQVGDNRIKAASSVVHPLLSKPDLPLT